MKKYAILLALASTAMLSACTTTGTNTSVGTATNVGIGLFSQAVDYKCRQELTTNRVWKVASLAMTDAQQEQVQTKVCGCVSEKAPQNVTMVEIAQATVDANARTKIVANTVAKTLESCLADYVSK